MIFNKKGQILDRGSFSLIIGLILIILIGPTILKLIFTGFQSTNLEDILVPLVVLAIFFELIRRLIG